MPLRGRVTGRRIQESVAKKGSLPFARNEVCCFTIKADYRSDSGSLKTFVLELIKHFAIIHFN